MKKHFLIIHNNKIIFFLVSIYYLIINQVQSIEYLEYPTGISLINGNILIITKYAISIYEPINFNKISTQYTFSDDEIIKDENDLSKVILKRYRECIFSLINYKIFFFDIEGNLLNKSDNKLIQENPDYCTLSIFNINNNLYYYIIGYFNSTNYLKLLYYRYDYSNNKNIYITTKIDRQYKDYIDSNNYYSYNFVNKGLGCEYLYGYDDSDECLVCFFVILDDNNKEFLIQGYFHITETSIINYY